MKKCTNHPDRNTTLFCHSCGKPFCEECLINSGDYLYCNDFECRKNMPLKTKTILPDEIICPNCSCILELELNEQSFGIVHCTNCDSLIDFTVNPPAVTNPKEYVELFSTLNVGDIVVIKSVLDDAHIDYYVAGENFAIIDPLIQPARFFIVKEQINNVKELLKDFNLHLYGVSTNLKEDN